MIEFRFSDFLSPRLLIKWHRLLWKSQYWPVERLRELQRELLSQTLDHCFEHVPYYRKSFRELGLQRSDFTSLETLAKLPIIDKFTVKEHYDEFKADNFNKFHPQAIRTMGSTGTPFVVYWDIGSNILELMCQYRHFSWAGYRLGEPFLNIRSVSLDDPKGYKWNWKCRVLEVSSDTIDASNIAAYAELLRKYRIKMWRGYPESIYYLCRMLSDAGIDDIKPKYINSIAVNVLKYQREYIESWTGVPVCDNYGQKEHVALITQCPETGGYHLVMEYGIVEIIKDDGSPAKPGEEGRIVGTTLHNRAFPLIRYNVMDYAVASERTCSCGRTLPLIERLTGRINDFLLDTRGRWISAPYRPLYQIDNIIKAQCIQKRKNAIELYIVPDTLYTPADDRIIIAEYKKKLGQSMEVHIHHVNEVPYPRPGKKYKFCINKLKDKESLSP